MNILYLSQADLLSRRANSIQVMKMCAAFAGNGCRVTLVANVPPWVSRKEIQLKYGVALDCFKIKGIPVLPMPGYGIFFALFAAVRVFWNRPDVIYGRFTTACYFASFSGVPVFFEVHSAPDEWRGIHGIMGRRLLSSGRLAGLVCISEALRDHVERLYPLLRGRTLVAADGADAQPSANKDSYRRKNGKRFTVGYVGSMNPGKGAEFAVALAAHFPEADFLIVGGERSKIEKCRTKASENVTFLGYVEPRRIPELISQLDVALAPYGVTSKSPGGAEIGRWMSPLKIFEYMAAGTPMIVSDLKVLREIVQDRQTALLAPPGDMVGWISALQKMMSDAPLRNGIAERARALFESQYSWSSRGRKIIKFIQRIVASEF